MGGKKRSRCSKQIKSLRERVNGTKKNIWKLNEKPKIVVIDLDQAKAVD